MIVTLSCCSFFMDISKLTLFILSEPRTTKDQRRSTYYRKTSIVENECRRQLTRKGAMIERRFSSCKKDTTNDSSEGTLTHRYTLFLWFWKRKRTTLRKHSRFLMSFVEKKSKESIHATSFRLDKKKWPETLGKVLTSKTCSVLSSQARVKVSEEEKSKVKVTCFL